MRTLAPSCDDPMPEVPERFRVLRRVGRGALADVWRAIDTTTGGEVALKVQTLRGPDARARLLREARLLSSVDHPRILRVIAWGQTPTPWLATELHARSLHAQRGVGPLPTAELLQMVHDVLDGLGHLHSQGILHRDMKPANVLRTATGRYVVCDLGIARPTDPEATQLTRTDQLLGSHMYMSPEQRADPHRVDARSDLYGVAATLWFASVGRRPPDLSLLYLQPRLIEALPVVLRDVVARASAYDPADRYPTAAAMAQALPSARAT